MTATSATQYGLKRSATPLWLRICPGRPCCLLQCYIPKGTTKQSTTEKVLAEPFDKQIISFLYVLDLIHRGKWIFYTPKDNVLMFYGECYTLCVLSCALLQGRYVPVWIIGGRWLGGALLLFAKHQVSPGLSANHQVSPLQPGITQGDLLLSKPSLLPQLTIFVFVSLFVYLHQPPWLLPHFVLLTVQVWDN